MLDQADDLRRKAATRSGPSLDFQEHLAALEASGLVQRIDTPINKDTELHPLVRWQFVGGVPHGPATLVELPIQFLSIKSITPST